MYKAIIVLGAIVLCGVHANGLSDALAGIAKGGLNTNTIIIDTFDKLRDLLFSNPYDVS
jgi:hypothetical protein